MPSRGKLDQILKTQDQIGWGPFFPGHVSVEWRKSYEYEAESKANPPAQSIDGSIDG
jgi:hypothetical protein